MAIKKQQILQLQDETKNTLERIWKENSHLRSIHYFLDQAFYWHSADMRKRMKPEVAVIGTDVPEELLLAADVKPYWILGGSQTATLWSDELVPRDTDPVSRAQLGYIHEPDGVDFSETLFIIPTNSDSTRKMANLLIEEGREVFALDVPPEKDEISGENYADAIEEMLEAVCDHTGKTITNASLHTGIWTTSQARYRLNNFLTITAGQEEIIHGSARMLVANSYYYASDIGEWSKHLKELTDEINFLLDEPLPVAVHKQRIQRASEQANAADAADLPNVLLMGSPVLFPNYKIPFLMEDVGLKIAETITAGDEKNRLDGLGRRRRRIVADKMIRQIAAAYLEVSSSGAFAKNSSLEEKVIAAAEGGNIEGVVFHILKGQIEYDFELLRYEKIFERAGIPVFRLETDYQYQDIEQLRIRMEAFSEMLRHYHLINRKEALAQ